MAWAENAPNPGSLEAHDLGCECPVIDNCHGQGYLGQEGLFVTALGCPLHDLPDEEAADGND